MRGLGRRAIFRDDLDRARFARQVAAFGRAHRQARRLVPARRARVALR
ncbi:MAG TPA: hypothetical protein VED18_09505 [Candidatus Sulfotelmatobacter sp.]|nr:hypothetical protein [Candidatus Sulfotelmatobacter sp.]